jgi:aminoglycoside phosphotransferase family enzyme/predicted kinase
MPSRERIWVDQTETVEFLSSGSAFSSGEPVEVVETHGAYVFLCGDTVLKLKRAVRYDYMDLSTVELRQRMIARELELNRPRAPEIYRDMLPITRTRYGLALGGDGPVVDWVLRMWRFPAEHELEVIAQRGGFNDRLADATGKEIFSYHASVPVRDQPGRVLISDILAELGRVFDEYKGAAGTERIAEWQMAAAEALGDVGDTLDARSKEGHVRRAHGDLHLRNLVLIEGRPVPFDALEFDETLGTCDVLYDIAFLVMDLCHRGLWRQACLTLAAWLREARGAQDAGLVGLPLFLSVRAAIRAMVLLQTDKARRMIGASAAEISEYVTLACDALKPKAPKLIAVGGFSGSGKSVLARSLAPEIGALPGAVLLNSDQERKAGLSQDARLDLHEYSVDRRDAVYRAMFGRAEAILGAGHSVILDATFIDPRLRAMAGEVAIASSVPFAGFWLDAPRKLLFERVRGRTGDASDAGAEVLETQLVADLGEIFWTKVDADGDVDDVKALVMEYLDAPASN